MEESQYSKSRIEAVSVLGWVTSRDDAVDCVVAERGSNSGYFLDS